MANRDTPPPPDVMTLLVQCMAQNSQMLQVIINQQGQQQVTDQLGLQTNPPSSAALH